ncbi:MAG TPA: hypothetical protein VF755_05365, partial [Catenuloplanes sp.]
MAAMLAGPCPEFLPLLVMRTGDWVRAVRDRARAGLVLLLADDPGTYLPAVLPTALAVEGRRRGGFAGTQVLAALVAAPPALRQAVAAGADRGQRRFLFDIALGQGWLRRDDLVAAAEADPDVVIRGRAAEAACREALWTRHTATLDRLTRSRSARGPGR